MRPVQDRAKGCLLGVLAYIYLTLLNFSYPISLSLHTAYTFKLSLRCPESNPTCTAISNRHFHPKGSFPHPRSRSHLGLAKPFEYQYLCAFFFPLRALLASLLSFWSDPSVLSHRGIYISYQEGPHHTTTSSTAKNGNQIPIPMIQLELPFTLDKLWDQQYLLLPTIIATTLLK